MSDPILWSILKSAVTPFAKVTKLVYERFRRPTISLSRAPKNLFDHIKPGVSVGRARDVLGAPHQEGDGQYRYIFLDACIQIDSVDHVTIDAVSVGLSRVGWRSRFPISPIRDLVLGKTTFREILEPDAKIEFDYSSKFYHFHVTKYYGFPGFYWKYALGVLECPGVSPDGHHWSPDQQSREEIPEGMKINWVCVTRLEEPPAFNYFGFL